jgi:small subunit ribosomal protein S1
MDIRAVIRSIENGRINLSHKELLGTWEQNASLFAVGQTVTGIIRSVENYGAFVELTPNLAGLSEVRGEEHANELKRLIGHSASVYIKSILPERMKIKLVLIDSWQEPLPRPELRYFIDTASVRHMDRWQYSPDGSRKLIESVFEETEAEESLESAACVL